LNSNGSLDFSEFSKANQGGGTCGCQAPAESPILSEQEKE
jgi:hypothetical protein